MSWFEGAEAVAGFAVLAAVWLFMRLLQRRQSDRPASALGMALLPVSVLLVIVAGVVLILDGAGAL